MIHPATPLINTANHVTQKSTILPFSPPTVRLNYYATFSKKILTNPDASNMQKRSEKVFFLNASLFKGLGHVTKPAPPPRQCPLGEKDRARAARNGERSQSPSEPIQQVCRGFKVSTHPPRILKPNPVLFLLSLSFQIIGKSF